MYISLDSENVDQYETCHSFKVRRTMIAHNTKTGMFGLQGY